MSTYDISADPARLDLAAIHAFLSRSYWSPGAPLDAPDRFMRIHRPTASRQGQVAP